MICPNCKHVYPIMNGIPNMVRTDVIPSYVGLIVVQLLAEDEIA